jgi:hypothetical protein
VLAIAGLGCWRLRTLASRERTRLLVAATIGAILAAIPLATYDLLAFGSITQIGYDSVVGFEGMRTGLFGVSLPRPEVLGELLWGTRRGILWLSPLLLAIPFAWVASFRRLRAPITLVLIGIPVAYLLINSGYAYWDGGASTGPRHLTPMLPFIGLALVPLWEVARRGRIGLLILAGASFVLSLICAAVSMTTPLAANGVWITNELTGSILPQFFAGNVHHLLAPAGGGGIASLLVPLIPALLELVASGVAPLLRGQRRALAGHSPAGG